MTDVPSVLSVASEDAGVKFGAPEATCPNLSCSFVLGMVTVARVSGLSFFPSSANALQLVHHAMRHGPHESLHQTKTNSTARLDVLRFTVLLPLGFCH